MGKKIKCVLKASEEVVRVLEGNKTARARVFGRGLSRLYPIQPPPPARPPARPIPPDPARSFSRPIPRSFVLRAHPSWGFWPIGNQEPRHQNRSVCLRGRMPEEKNQMILHSFQCRQISVAAVVAEFYWQIDFDKKKFRGGREGGCFFGILILILFLILILILC